MTESKINEVNVQVNDQHDVELYGYGSQFSQVVLNIVNNSIDALKLKEADRSIIIDIDQVGSKSVLSIRDNGGGILPDQLPKLFDPYFTTKEKDAGTGIGLYMSKLIIERNFDGEIEVENTQFGLEMKLLIPIKDDLHGE